jgi:hypothetical protein
MISAANLPQLLSGSKLLIFFWGILFLMSCGSPRKVVGPPTTPLPVEDDKEVVIDTVHWEILSPVDHPPIIYPDDSPFRERIAEGLPSPEFKSTYHILLVLPMEDWPTDYQLDELLGELDELIKEEPEENIRLSNYINEEMIGFLNGFEFALKSQTDLPFKIVLEVKAGGIDKAEELKNTLSKVKFPPDVIVGGSNRTELEILSEFSSEHQAVLISPWFAGQFIPDPKSKVVSVQPDLMSHFETVLERLHYMEEEDKFYIIYSAREKGRVEQFKELFFASYPNRTFEEIFFQSDEDILEFSFEKYFFTGKKTWFFVPMTRNHPFIHPILRAIDLTKRSRDYEVIGITLWDRDIHLEFHQKLNLVNTSAQLPVAGNRDYRKFHLHFFDKKKIHWWAS